MNRARAGPSRPCACCLQTSTSANPVWRVSLGVRDSAGFVSDARGSAADSVRSVCASAAYAGIHINATAATATSRLALSSMVISWVNLSRFDRDWRQGVQRKRYKKSDREQIDVALALRSALAENKERPASYRGHARALSCPSARRRDYNVARIRSSRTAATATAKHIAMRSCSGERVRKRIA